MESISPILTDRHRSQKRRLMLVLLTSSAVLYFALLLVWQPGLEVLSIMSIVLLGLPVLILTLHSMVIGLSMTVLFGFLIGFLGKNIDLPLGISIDVMLFLLGLLFMVNLTRTQANSELKNPLTIFILIWIGYCLCQLFNPFAASKTAWLFTIRGMAVLHLFYFIAIKSFRSLADIRKFFKFVIFLGLLSALYGFQQELFGLSPAEERYLYSQPITELFYAFGRLRNFSIFSDPTTFGILMSFLGIFSLILSTRANSKRSRIFYLLSGVTMIAAMPLTGSRTAVLMVIAAAFFYLILRPKKIFILLGFVLVSMLPIALTTDSNAILYRMQTVLQPGQDASWMVRLDNQKQIQGYIQRHPVGGGMGSTGIWGQRFSPNTYLANFPPDSLYVRLAVETGWIGLLVYLGMLFTAFHHCIRSFNQALNREIKTMYLALATSLFVLTIANFPQEATFLQPISLLFYIFLGVIVKLKQFDAPEFENAKNDD